jgi:hypothetical protein
MTKNGTIIFIILFLLTSQIRYHEVYAEAKVKDPVNELINKMNKAANTDALKTTKGIFLKMTMVVPQANITGTSETTATSNKAYMKISMAGMEQEMGYDGKKAWSKDIAQGLREITGQEKESLVQYTIDVQKDLKSYYTEIVAADNEKFEEKECLVLIYKKEGIPDKKVFIDKTTFLPSGSVEIQDGPQGKMTVKSIIHSYKKTENGSMLPEKITQDMGIMKMKFTITEVKVNPTIDEKIFNQPEN